LRARPQTKGLRGSGQRQDAARHGVAQRNLLAGRVLAEVGVVPGARERQPAREKTGAAADGAAAIAAAREAALRGQLVLVGVGCDLQAPGVGRAVEFPVANTLVILIANPMVAVIRNGPLYAHRRFSYATTRLGS
jgi:hypothetical protein